MRIIIKPLGVLLVQAIVAAMLFISAGYHAVQQAAATARQSAMQSIAAVPSSETVQPAPMTAPSADTAIGTSVYHDGFENGWESAQWTWAKEVDFASTQCPNSSGHAIRVRFRGADGLKFHHKPLSTESIDRITFRINGGQGGGQRVLVAGSFVGASPSPGVLLSPLPTHQWVTVTLPLRELGASKAHPLESFWIQSHTGKPQASLFVDDIRLMKSDEPAPPGVTMAYTPLAH